MPIYRVRESRRALRVRLRISRGEGLEVVVPYGFDRERIPAIVQSKLSWINRVSERLRLAGTDDVSMLPERIDLKAIDERWMVRLNPTPRRRVSLEEKDDCLLLHGAAHNHGMVRRALLDWVSYKANVHLTPMLNDLSRRHSLPFHYCMVKSQRTRWGSCSGRKIINLNRKLIFLPFDAVRYVMLHELCHTVFMNHSQKFWSLLSGLEPRARELDASLRHSAQHIPLWAELRNN